MDKRNNYEQRKLGQEMGGKCGSARHRGEEQPDRGPSQGQCDAHGARKGTSPRPKLEHSQVSSSSGDSDPKSCESKAEGRGSKAVGDAGVGKGGLEWHI